ncbi:hypothetical protein PMIN06_011088 [Paraphaeosphaeria minitans]
MSPFTSRPQTPPPAEATEHGQLTPPATVGKPPATPQKQGISTSNQLLTPPSTGATRKIARFIEKRGSPTASKRRRFDRKNKDEYAVAEYAELDDLSDANDVSISNESPGSSAPASPTDSPDSLETRTPVSRDEAFTGIDTDDEALGGTSSTSTTKVATSPFPFMKLPRSIRKRIYAHLLAVPGLICVRQNHTSYHNEEKAFLYAEERRLLPGIAYALPQLVVGGFKTRFARLGGNVGVLRVCREVEREARGVLYGSNAFEITCPALELSPPPDFSIPLLPRGCARLVRHLSIRLRALYPLRWLLAGGYASLKDAYRDLEQLDIVLEMEDAAKGPAKGLGKKDREGWSAYVTRLRAHLVITLFDSPHRNQHLLPIWINLRVLFPGEAYDDRTESDPHNIHINVDMGPGNASPTDVAEERLRRYHLKRGLAEAFELCKQGRR